MHPETYVCCVHTEREALTLIKLASMNMIPRIRKRLNKREREYIKPGSVFVYNENETGIRRWTDRREWTPSRVQGIFLMYRELNGELLKKTYRVMMADGRWHLIAYSVIEWEVHGRCCPYFGEAGQIFGKRYWPPIFPKGFLFKYGSRYPNSFMNAYSYARQPDIDMCQIDSNGLSYEQCDNSIYRKSWEDSQNYIPLDMSCMNAPGPGSIHSEYYDSVSSMGNINSQAMTPVSENSRLQMSSRVQEIEEFLNDLHPPSKSESESVEELGSFLSNSTTESTPANNESPPN